MSDQQPPNTQAPWWDQTIMKVGTTFGVPTLVLGYLLLQNAGIIPNPVEQRLDDIDAKLEEVKGAVVQQGTGMQEIGKQMARDAERRQMWCVMRAKTDEEKKACFAEGKHQ